MASKKVAAIEEEFGEAFEAVVQGFAEMGYSRRATAEILEINLSYFRQLCVKYDLHQYFKLQKDMRRECRKTGGGGWPKGKKRPYRPRHTDEELLADVRRYRVTTTFEAMSQYSASTIHRRFGSWENAKQRAFGRGV